MLKPIWQGLGKAEHFQEIEHKHKPDLDNLRGTQSWPNPEES